LTTTPEAISGLSGITQLGGKEKALSQLKKYSDKQRNDLEPDAQREFEIEKKLKQAEQ